MLIAGLLVSKARSAAPTPEADPTMRRAVGPGV